jgi:antirestriction protein ArdC
MSKKATAATKPSVYQIVTDRIIASLKTGVIPWEKPWQTPHFAGDPFPRNFRTGKRYRGINIMLLWSCSYSSPFWLTFNQAKELNGSVRKGEKGTQIVFYKQLSDRQKTDDEQTAEEDRRAPFVLTYHTVFNVEQCDGLTLPQIEQPTPRNEVEVDETCEAIVSGWSNCPSLQLTSETEYRAYYRPSTDSVHMPARARFVDAPHYYSTLFHELIHSTGHETRLNRTFGAHFGDELYSKEELVAEMGAAFLCAIAGVSNDNTDRNTTAYIQNWISQLQEDNRLIIQAAANAQRAVDAILGFSFENADESASEKTVTFTPQTEAVTEPQLRPRLTGALEVDVEGITLDIRSIKHLRGSSYVEFRRDDPAYCQCLPGEDILRQHADSGY